MEKKSCFNCKVSYPLYMFNQNYGKPVSTCKQCMFEKRAKTMLPSRYARESMYYDDLDRMVYQAGFIAWVRKDIDHREFIEDIDYDTMWD